MATEAQQRMLWAVALAKGRPIGRPRKLAEGGPREDA